MVSLKSGRLMSSRDGEDGVNASMGAAIGFYLVYYILHPSALDLRSFFLCFLRLRVLNNCPPTFGWFFFWSSYQYDQSPSRSPESTSNWQGQAGFFLSVAEWQSDNERNISHFTRSKWSPSPDIKIGKEIIYNQIQINTN